jgi:hypothetical protein
MEMLSMNDKMSVCRFSMFVNFATRVNPSINKVVDFAKRIPGMLHGSLMSCPASFEKFSQLGTPY